MDSRPTRLEVLGPLRLLVAGADVQLGAPKQQAVLAMLALHAGSVVSKQALIDGVWGEQVPATAMGSLYTYLSNLRLALAGSQLELVRSGGGYRLEFDAALLDVSQVLELVGLPQDRDQGRPVGPAYATDGPAAERERIEAALSRWHGPDALAGVPGPYAEQRRADYERLRRRLATRRARLAIEAGHAEAAVQQLRAELARHPYDEQLAALLLTALGLTGRRSEALSFFDDFRQQLVEELGVEPGPEVRAARDRATRANQSGNAPVAADETTFVGRAAEIDTVLGLAALASDDPAELGRSIATVITVVGIGGIGKSAFAAECARRLAGQFTDGQFTIDLNGYAPNTAPLSKHEILHALLRGVGVESIPDDYSARLDRYRHAMRTSRRLIVLDNARPSSDLADLVDVGPANLIILTSRDHLTHLVRAHHAQRVHLAHLSPLEARTLLAATIDRSRLSGHRSDLTRLARLCDNLPLALHIAAQQINTRPGHDVAALVDALAHAGNRLDVLQLDDRAGTGTSPPSVRAAFQWSYEKLPRDASRQLRALATLPCDAFPPLFVATVTNQPPDAARNATTVLLEQHLLEQSGNGYTMHDLTRACALEAAADDSVDSHDEAVVRAAAWYVASMANGHDIMGFPAWPPLTDWPNCAPQTFASIGDFTAWMSVHIRSVAALIPAAHHAGYPDHGARLASLTFPYFHNSGRLTEWVAVVNDGLAAAEAADDTEERASLLNTLGVAMSRMGDHGRAILRFQESLDLHAEEDPGRAGVLGNLAWALCRAGRHEEALDVAIEELREADKFSDAYYRIGSLVTLSEIYVVTGRSELAITSVQQALAIDDADALVQYEANLLVSLGIARRLLNQLDQSRTAFRRALVVARGHRQTYQEAIAEFELARTEAAAGNTELARTTAQRAEGRFHDLASKEEADVTAFLAELDAGTRPGEPESLRTTCP